MELAEGIEFFHGAELEVGQFLVDLAALFLGEILFDTFASSTDQYYLVSDHSSLMEGAAFFHCVDRKSVV